MDIKPLLSHVDTANFIKQYLVACGVDESGLDDYISPNRFMFQSPSLYPTMSEAINLLHSSIANEDKIGILVDSDCDGYMSAAILYDFIVYGIGYNNVVMFHHIPKAHGLRSNEDEDPVADIVRANVNLIITPDAGTGDVYESIELDNYGVKMLVIDHHPIEHDRHKAVIVNPHFANVPELNKNISGAGVVYKFVEAYAKKFYQHNLGIQYMDMVALSLISDVCDLREPENRAFVHFGLDIIRRGNGNQFIKLGYDKLCRDECTPHGFAFGLIPAINSVTRSTSYDAKQSLFDALVAKIPPEDGLRIANRCRRVQNETVKSMYADVDPIINKEHKALIGFAEATNKAYIGLTANKFLSSYGKPTIILREANPLEWSGSLRSPIPLASKINDTDLALCQGHEEACGIVVRKSNLSRLAKFLDKLDLRVNPEIEVAACLDSTDDLMPLCKQIEANAELFGHGVPEPLFYFDINVSANAVAIFQKSSTTIRIQHDGITFLKFFASDKDIDVLDIQDYSNVKLVATLGVNEYNGVKSVQAKIQQYEVMPLTDSPFPDGFDWDDLFK